MTLTLESVVAVADDGLDPWVRANVPLEARCDALGEELAWAVSVATVDLDFAAAFASAQPQSGQAAEAFLNRWIDVDDDLSVLAGPRYRGRDPHRPFVGVDASTRVLRQPDLEALRSALGPAFEAFARTYISFWSSVPARTWPGCGADKRDLVGALTELAAQPLPGELSVRVATDLSFYPRYQRIHEQQVAAEPEHATHTRLETREDLAELVEEGLVLDVLVEGRWAGVLATWRAVRRGLRGFEVVELLLDPQVRGRGYGRHLSCALAASVLARGDRSPADQYLLGTIYVDNARAYRSASAAGRRDVGGEMIVPLE